MNIIDFDSFLKCSVDVSFLIICFLQIVIYTSFNLLGPEFERVRTRAINNYVSSMEPKGNSCAG